MSTPLLVTKLYIPPPRPNVVLRSRLIERLNAGLHCKLTLISAPAGFGKTTLVSEWVAGCGRPAAWLSLDEGDNDPARFLTYLVAALQTLAAHIGEGVMGALHSSQSPAIESVLTTLLNDITTLPDNFVLVLDDYHVVDTPRIDQTLTFLLEHMPPQMRVVITTREDPSLPLARLRARAQLSELRAADLRFTPSEAAEFLNHVMGLRLSEADVVTLENRTEGWIAGLQLVALSMQGRQDVAGFIRTFAGDHRYIVDYLVEEVLQRQPERVRSFLLQTSILDRLSASLCDAVTERDDSRAVLTALERGNLFVVPLDDNRHWFRYHHLFAEMLAVHALREQPAHVPIWHQRASAWYADNGLPADAIRHALAARDFVRAAGLVERAWPAMDGRFQSATWLGWARALPDELIRARPVLSVAYGWALLNSGELEAGEACLRDAERWLDTTADPAARPDAPSPEVRPEPSQTMVVVDEAQFRTLPASIATARAYLAQVRGDLFGCVKYGRQALDLLPEGDYLRRGPAAALLALAQWASGDLDAAHRALADAMAGFQAVGSLQFAISGTYGLADIRTTQGRLREAVKTYTQALEFALAQGEPLLRGTATLYLGLSELSYEQGNLGVSLQHLLRSQELGDQAGLPSWRYRVCRFRARLKEAQGDLSGALDLLDEAERHYHKTSVPIVRPLAALKTRVWVAQGRLSEAQGWAHDQGLSVDDKLGFLREFEHMTLARVLIAEYTHARTDRAIHEALRLLDRLQQAAQAGGRMGSVIEIAVLQALAHHARSDLTPALVALEHALLLAEPEGYVRTFVDEGPAMARLLSAAATQGIMPAYTRKLLAAFASVETEAQPQANKADLRPASPVQPLIEPLSIREMEVLQLMAQGLSNDEISARLYVALSTVKGHNRNIFDKLQVQRRSAAVARARELGLL